MDEQHPAHPTDCCGVELASAAVVVGNTARVFGFGSDDFGFVKRGPGVVTDKVKRACQ